MNASDHGDSGEFVALSWGDSLAALVGAVGTFITVSVTTMTESPRPVAHVGGIFRGGFADPDVAESVMLNFACGHVVLQQHLFKVASWVAPDYLALDMTDLGVLIDFDPEGAGRRTPEP